jgi:4-hydroxy-4-methyl-2-oxoglutarate aldolase
MAPAGSKSSVDPFQVCKLYKYLRVVDVCDGLDGIGYFDLTLMSPEVRPLWLGMKFWGVALTVRCVPANRPMWKLATTEEIVDAHGIWFKEMGHLDIGALVKPGHVVVTDTGGAKEVGFWGSANSMSLTVAGAVGIVTDGYARDTAELTLQRTPVCARARGRTIIPGRIEVADLQTRIGCGGVQVRPGDIIGCDDDGVVVVPIEVAHEVALHSRAVLLSDMRARASLYQKLAKTSDETVDYEQVKAYYRQFE